MNDIGNAGTGSTYGELVTTASQIIEKWLNLGFGIYHELYVVTGGETEETITMFICDITHFADKLDGNQTGSPDTDCPTLITGL
jgi:hypothetical protein